MMSLVDYTEWKLTATSFWMSVFLKGKRNKILLQKFSLLNNLDSYKRTANSYQPSCRTSLSTHGAIHSVVVVTDSLVHCHEAHHSEGQYSAKAKFLLGNGGICSPQNDAY